MFYFNDPTLQVLKCARQEVENAQHSDGTDIDQLHYFNAECPFWVFNYNSTVTPITVAC